MEMKELIKDAEEIINTAYENGYKAGEQSTDDSYTIRAKEMQEDAYEEGARDMFSVIRKILADKKNGGMSVDDIYKIFTRTSLADIMEVHADDPVSIIRKVREFYQQSLQVGDEVTVSGVEDTRYVITHISGNTIHLMNKYGVHGAANRSAVHPTGRKFYTLAAVQQALGTRETM